MDTFFGPGTIFHDDIVYDIRLPYSGQIPPPGYILFHDSVTYYSPTPSPFMNPPIYDYHLY